MTRSRRNEFDKVKSNWVKKPKRHFWIMVPDHLTMVKCLRCEITADQIDCRAASLHEKFRHNPDYKICWKSKELMEGSTPQ